MRFERDSSHTRGPCGTQFAGFTTTQVQILHGCRDSDTETLSTHQHAGAWTLAAAIQNYVRTARQKQIQRHISQYYHSGCLWLRDIRRGRLREAFPPRIVLEWLRNHF